MVPRVFSSQSYNALRLIFFALVGYFSAGNAKNARQYKSIACAFQRPRRKTISTRKAVAIFPPETLKMLANTKVLPALFNVPDEKLSQREKQWLFFRRKRQTKSYLNDNGTAEIY